MCACTFVWFLSYCLLSGSLLCRDCSVAISKISYKVICTTGSGGKWELGIVWRIDVSTPSRGGEIEKIVGIVFIVLLGLKSSILSKDILPFFRV